jgi:hypothetical protein
MVVIQKFPKLYTLKVYTIGHLWSETKAIPER